MSYPHDTGTGDNIEHETALAAADCVIAPLQPSGVDVATLSSAAAGPSTERGTGSTYRRCYVNSEPVLPTPGCSRPRQSVLLNVPLGNHVVVVLMLGLTPSRCSIL